MTQYALLGLGSNVDPEQHIAAMVSALSERFGQLWISSVTRTHPVGVENADDFLNVVVGIQTSMNGRELKAWTKQQEKLLGRDHANPMEHRRACVADMDILALWNGKDSLVDASEFVNEPFFLPLADEALDLMGKEDAELVETFSASPVDDRVSLSLQDGSSFGLSPMQILR
ncbi:MAG: 2-amino-4-hydroxy-6-hydroxymethyldihydropteridine diphosphokinase [Oceanospirillales bacterium LUC14_002_19_P2]|nr:MAG: 2-amino-4-hydroxy-6-hydroxymethyldihydropteridine diphosphokinase [Oceanospirillales bacterium LUC14_002_19_P2]